jgi:hypothetical protein
MPNELAHSVIENHDPIYYQLAQRGALIRCRGELRFRVGIPYSMICEFRMSTEEIGITEELLQATLREIDDGKA